MEVVDADSCAPGQGRGRSLTTLTRRDRYLGGTGNVNDIQIFPYNLQ